jgi:tetratricopeptide (TPR) repeat protein
MKIFKTVFAIVVLVAVTLESSKAQSFDSLMYRAYLLNSHSLWELALEQQNDKDSLQKAIAFYGLLNNTMVSSKEEIFDKYVDPALEYLEFMEKQEVHKAEALALESSIYGFIMAYSPWKGMYYGSKGSSAMEDALDSDGNSAIVNMISGTSLYYTPETFGGDKRKAIVAFEKAVKLYEQQGYRGWLYLNTLGNLGNAHMEVGQKQEAISTFEKALEVEPDFKWVSKKLLPSARAMND